MATYTIRVNNRSGVAQNYFLFSKTPDVSGNDDVYTNALARVRVQLNGTGSFGFRRTYHAICGHTTGSLDTGVLISSYQAQEVHLSTNNNGTNIPMIGKGAPAPEAFFDLDKITTDVTTPGAFRINTSTGFALTDNLFIGLGAIDPVTQSTFPVAVFKAQANVNHLITPHPVYYVAMGDYNPGEIIDVSSFSDAVTVSFSGRNELGATVTHDAQGNYTVAYNNTLEA